VYAAWRTRRARVVGRVRVIQRKRRRRRRGRGRFEATQRLL